MRSLAAAPGLVLVVAVAACGQSKPPEDPCPGGICTSGSAGMGGTTGGAGTSGAAGTTGDAGTTGSAGATGDAGTAGSGTAGTTGGTGGGVIGGATGGGGSGAAGAAGRGGATGSAGRGGTGGATPPADAGTDAPLAALDMEFYKCNVHPIFARSCSMLGCHGDEARAIPGQFRMYAISRLRNTAEANPASCGPRMLASGTVHCTGPVTPTEWQRSFDSARQFMRAGADPEQSDMLRQPTKGGLAHVNVHPFTKNDASYTMVRRWLGGETLGRTCVPP